MQQEYQTYYADLRQRVDSSLSQQFSSVAIPEPLRQAVCYSLAAPGKRLRPVLVLMAVDVCRGMVDDGLPAACAVEMIHTYSLIHDDLPAMDDDSLRRGIPTSHVVYGEALAILAGDTLLTHAFASLAGSAAAPEITGDCLRILSSAAGGAGMLGGQVLDLSAERGPFPGVETFGKVEKTEQNGSFTSLAADSRVADNQNRIAEPPTIGHADDLEKLMQIHRMKTGALITASLELGAAVVQADPDIRYRLRTYGECCGLAFQIADDLLDVTGCGAKLGKETGRDRELGKLTYPGVLGVEGSRRKAAELIDKACGCLSVFEERAEPLRQLAQFIVERDH
ncbi:MAG: polyprenyl synthetase family protein [Fuerstiella sp.]|nr:polyprenyl synthetase family protein [Fuerstiella sp.]